MASDGHVRIMYLMDSYVDPHAGTEKQLFQLISHLADYNYEPHLTLLRPSKYIEKHGFPCEVSVLDIGKIIKLQSLLKMFRYGIKLRMEGYKLVHIFFNDSSIIAPVILRLCGIKVIISRRDMGYWYTPANLILLRLNALFVSAVVTNCNAVKQVTHRQEHIPLAKIHVIFNGYQAQDISGVNVIPDSIKHIKGRLKIVGIVANIRPIKRIEDLVNAFAMVKKQLNDVALVIVGAGETVGLMRLAGDLGIADAVIMTGKQPDTEAFIRHFDVAVLCSESEGLSNSLIEYMYYGIPIVCTRAGGNVELVENGINGYLVDVGDIHALAGRLLTLLQNEALAYEFGRKSSQYIREVCSMNRMTETHVSLYKGLRVEN